MFRKFFEEERAQGSIEYLLIAGGVILAAIVVLSIYGNMSRSSITMLNESVGVKVEEMTSSLAAQNLSA